MTLPLALAVGIEGVDEVMELELAESPPPDALLRRLRRNRPPGAVVRCDRSRCPRQPQGPSPAVPPTRRPFPRHRARPRRRIERLLAAWRPGRSRRPRRSGPVDLRRASRSWPWRKACCGCGCGSVAKASAGPRDVLAALGLADLEQARECHLRAHRRGDRAMSARVRTQAASPPLRCVLAGIAEQESDIMKQEMLINVSQPEECRIAIVEDGVLEELYVERTGQDNYVGNIYKGVVVNLEPSIQAAFVDFGVGRNGFLHISDIEPQYFRQGGYDPRKPIGPSAARPPCHATAVGDEPKRSGRRGRVPARDSVRAAARASSRRSRKSSAAATKSSSK